MTRQKKKHTTWMAVLLTVCGGVLLIILLVMLILRYRMIELELDRMLMESLTAHTVEAGDGAQSLLSYVEALLDNANRYIVEDGREPKKDWLQSMVRTVNLGDRRFELSYRERQELAGLKSDDGEWELAGRVLTGEFVVSKIVLMPKHEACYIVVACPVRWEGRIVGALWARVNADMLIQQGQDSSFFHSVHSVIVGEDGLIVHGSVPEVEGVNMVELGASSGITQQEARELAAAYEADASGSFRYDPPGGRCYIAWAPISYNGWRIVQFSQSPTVQIERSSMVQTVVMLISLAVCGVMAAMLWRQRIRLANEKLRYDALAQFKDTLLFEYDCSSDSIEFTSNALETLDLEDARLEQITDEKGQFPIFHPDDIANVRRVLRNAGSMTPDQIEHDRIRMKKRDGGYSWYRSQYKAVFLANNRVSRVIGTLTDISAQIDREQELREQAQRDPLTGLYNRAGVKVINARLEQISRGILFMLDLDDFKTINDTYGHAAGDKVLVAMGQILSDTFRTDDIVARVGGDEFIAFLSGSDNEAMAQQKAQEMLDRVRSLRIEGIDQGISISVGISRSPGHGRTYETLSLSADEALYEIKGKGKGGYAMK